MQSQEATPEMSPDAWTILGARAVMYENIDRSIFDLVSLSWDAQPVVLASSMPFEVLHDLGYTDKFAGHLTLSHAFMHPESHNALVPAACLAIYPKLGQLPVQEGLAFTSRVKVFRYEEGLRGADRLWEFNVREVIFAGSPDYVSKALHDIRRQASELLNSWGIRARTAPASDYFTTNVRKARLLKALQLDSGAKMEWLVDHGGRSMAVGSLNYHGDHFSKHFGWSQSGSVVTGCVGFGLERCVLAVEDIQGG